MTTWLLKLYLAATGVFFAIDIIWLGVVAKKFYEKHLGYLMRPTPNWTAAILFYLLNIFGILVFAVVPSLKMNEPGKAILLGALFGLCTYATYDLTNLATIKNWPLIVTIIDLVWGTVLTATVSYISFLIGKRLQ